MMFFMLAGRSRARAANNRQLERFSPAVEN
jgi:hypothetical protein